MTFAAIFAVWAAGIAIGFAAGCWYTADQRDRREAERQEMLESIHRKRLA